MSKQQVTEVIWYEAKSLPIYFIRQEAAIRSLFWLRGSTPKSPFSLGVRDLPCDSVSLDPISVSAKSHVNCQSVERFQQRTSVTDVRPCYWNMGMGNTPCLKKKLCLCYFLNNSVEHWPI